jgi:hypothetical protein
MAPAFHSTRHALAFGGTVLFLLVLPVTLHSIGGVSIQESYAGISERAGYFDRIGHEIFEDSSDLDVFFCGSSLLNLGIDVKTVQSRMEQAVGHPVKALLLYQAWQGPDMQYYVSRALLEHRRVKLLVIAAPSWVQRSNQPHVQLFRVARYGDNPGALDGLGFGRKLAVYADYVLGAPRQALSLLRPNLVDPEAGLRPPAVVGLEGYQGRPFVPRPANDPGVPPSETIDSDASRQLFHFEGPPLRPYQLHFLKKTAEVARQHGALLVILHLPSPTERGETIVPERQYLPQVFGDGVFLLGIPSARLFRDVPDAQFFDYYQDEHMNRNGAGLFTQAIAPALSQLYERAAAAH